MLGIQLENELQGRSETHANVELYGCAPPPIQTKALH